MKRIVTIIFATLSCCFVETANAQGCSDAGFCTIGGFKHLPAKAANYKHRLGVQLTTGSGDEDVFVFTPALQYDLVLSKWTLQAKLTGNYASGNLGSVFAQGDLFLAGTYQFPSKSSWKWQGTIGTKLPLDQAKKSEGGRPLPMQYQGSLGTVDIIAGFTLSDRNWNFSIALQQPLTEENKNGFLPVYWNNTPEALAYPSSNRFRRKGDLLFRAGRHFNAGSKWQFNAGLLNILHLGKDSYTEIQPVQKVQVIEGSQGTTLNITGSVWYQLSKKCRIGVAGGAPVISRDVRPDGLTRSWVLSPEISFQF